MRTLPQKDHLIRLYEVSGDDSVEVDVTRDVHAGIRLAVPYSLVESGRFRLVVDESANETSRNIIYPQLNVRRLREIELDRRRRIEQVGIVLRERRLIRHFGYVGYLEREPACS